MVDVGDPDLFPYEASAFSNRQEQSRMLHQCRRFGLQVPSEGTSHEVDDQAELVLVSLCIIRVADDQNLGRCV